MSSHSAAGSQFPGLLAVLPANSAVCRHQFSAEVMVLSAGSVEGHLIIVRWKLQIEPDFNFCAGLPESQLPLQSSACWSISCESRYPLPPCRLRQPDRVVAGCLFFLGLLRRPDDFKTSKHSDDRD